MLFFLKKAVSSFLWFLCSMGLLLAVTFLASDFNPVDPALAIIGDTASQEVYQKQRALMALDRPFVERLFSYIKLSMMGEFGVSFTTGRSVLEDIKTIFPLTIDLSSLALLLSLLISVPLGSVCGYWARRPFDRWISAITFVGHSAPNFLIGYIILMLFLYMRGPSLMESHTSIFVSLFSGNFTQVWDVLYALWPPALTLTYLSSSYIVRMMRGFTMDEKGERYFITAKVKGLSTFRIFVKHLLPNIWPRLVPVLAFAYTALLEGSVITEMVFALPGLGSYLVHAVLYHDEPAIMGTTIAIGVAVFTVNMLADLCTVLVQPWLRVRGKP